MTPNEHIADYSEFCPDDPEAGYRNIMEGVDALVRVYEYSLEDALEGQAGNGFDPREIGADYCLFLIRDNGVRMDNYPWDDLAR